MDLKSYFKKIRDLEVSFGGSDVVVCSLETNDGGRAGVLTEVPARVASQLIVDRRARVATEEEKGSFREKQQADLAAAQEEALAQRIQVKLVNSLPEKPVSLKRKV